MEPFLRQGDHVLTFNWTNIKVGDVVVFRTSSHPAHPEVIRRILRFFSIAKNGSFVYFIKRILKISGKNIFVGGDNREMSSKMGPLKERQIVGRVIFKY